MPFKKGQTGNPNGRPKRDRALTAILETAGSRTVEVDGKGVSRKRLLSEHVWRVVTEGQTSFASGRTMQPKPREWLEFVRWLYTHIDGPAPTRVELTGEDGERLIPEPEPFDYDAYISAFAAIVGAAGAGVVGPDGDSESLDSPTTDG